MRVWSYLSSVLLKGIFCDNIGPQDKMVSNLNHLLWVLFLKSHFYDCNKAAKNFCEKVLKPKCISSIVIFNSHTEILNYNFFIQIYKHDKKLIGILLLAPKLFKRCFMKKVFLYMCNTFSRKSTKKLDLQKLFQKYWRITIL